MKKNKKQLQALLNRTLKAKKLLESKLNESEDSKTIVDEAKKSFELAQTAIKQLIREIPFANPNKIKKKDFSEKELRHIKETILIYKDLTDEIKKIITRIYQNPINYK